MELEEFHGVYAELHVHSRLENERLVCLVCKQLHADFRQRIKVFTANFLYELLGVGVYGALRQQRPACPLSSKKAVGYVVVGVVDEIQLEAC